mmetsp:Transcript_47606/g.85703  ORF Transcript_47606/g.85703 Transcript_47606/m.85703 type:complete len:143 (-) Transcript_47606:145-573(-)
MVRQLFIPLLFLFCAWPVCAEKLPDGCHGGSCGEGETSVLLQHVLPASVNATIHAATVQKDERATSLIEDESQNEEEGDERLLLTSRSEDTRRRRDCAHRRRRDGCDEKCSEGKCEANYKFYQGMCGATDDKCNVCNLQDCR